MRAAVASGGDAGRKRFLQRIELRRELLLKPVVGRRVGAVASLRAVDAPGLAVVAGSVPHHGHARRAAVGRLEERDFAAEGIVVGILRVLEVGKIARDADARHFGEGAVRRAGVESVGVRRIVLRRKAVAPAVVGRNPVLSPVVEVFALGVDVLANRTALEKRAHRDALGTERRRLVHHVEPAALLRRRDDFRDELELILAEERRHRARDVESVLKRHDRELRVARRVRRDVERLDLVGRGVLDKFLAARIRLLRLRALLEKFAPRGIEIGDGNDFGVRMRLVGELRAEAAHALARDADAHLAVGERRPLHVGELAGVTLLEALHLVFLLADARASGDRKQRRTRAHETPSADHDLFSFLFDL